jgi:hypothetical protein
MLKSKKNMHAEKNATTSKFGQFLPIKNGKRNEAWLWTQLCFLAFVASFLLGHSFMDPIQFKLLQNSI